MCNKLLKFGLVLFCTLITALEASAGGINENQDSVQTQLLQADNLYTTAVTARNEGRLEDAYVTFFQSLKIRWKYLGQDNVKVADAIYAATMAGMTLGHHPGEYKEVMEIATSTYKNVHGESSKEYLDATLLLAVIYGQEGDNDRALSLHQSCMKKKYNDDNKYSLEYLDNLFYEVEMALKLERWDVEKVLEKEMFEIVSRISAGDTLTFSLNQGLTNAYKKCGMNDRATYYAKQNVDLAKELWGENSIIYVDALIDRGISLYDIMPLESVEDLFYEALAIAKRNGFNTEQSVYVKLLWQLFFVCYDQMKYSDAIEYGMEYLRMSDNISFGNRFIIVEGLTESFKNLGQHDKAIDFLESYLNDTQNKMGVVCSEYLNALRMQGELYFDVEEWNKGMDKMVKCVSIAEENHALTIVAKCNASVCETMVNNTNKKLYNNVLNNGLNIARQNGDVYTLLRLLISAECQLLYSEDDTSQIVNAVNPIIHEIDSIFALPMFNVMKISDVKRKYQHDTYKLMALNISKIKEKGIAYVSESPQMIDELGKLCITKSNLVFEQFNKNLRNLTSNERAYYVNLLAEELKELVQVPIITCGRLGREDSYNALLQYRGAALQSDLSIKKTIFDSNDEALKAIYMSMRNNQNNLQKLCEMNYVGNKHLIDSLQNIIDQQEKQLVSKSKEYRAFVNELLVSWKDIESTLKDNEIAIELYAIPYDEGNAYVALLIRKDWEKPKYEILFEEEILDSKDIYKTDTLYKAFVKNLVPYLQEVNTIYFVADKNLNSIALENIPTDIDGVTFGEMYKLYRLSSTRELVQRKISAHGEFAIFGGADFNVYTIEENHHSSSFDSHLPKERFANAYTLTRGALSELPGTLIEAETISDIVTKSKQKSLKFIGDEATEEALKNLSGTPLKAIHIATHGFYWKDQEIDSIRVSNIGFLHSYNPYIVKSKSKSNHAIIEDKALTRNGVLLCGANKAIRGDEIPVQCEDGVLTAMEISRLDFRKVNLVTLSACETGLGEISGEGVFGLQRGFKKAGVNSILMSLWKVDDEATCKLMTEFYSNWIAKKMTKHDALEAAKKAVRETKGWENPKYWAAFILLDALD